jgi:hypothetical protein
MLQTAGVLDGLRQNSGLQPVREALRGADKYGLGDGDLSRSAGSLDNALVLGLGIDNRGGTSRRFPSKFFDDSWSHDVTDAIRVFAHPQSGD